MALTVPNIEIEDDKIEQEVKPSSLPEMEAELDRISEVFEKEAIKEEKKKKRKTALQALKYLIFTASAGLIELTTFTILHTCLPLAIDPNRQVMFFQMIPLYNLISTVVALTLSVLWNFTINRKFTFKSAGNVPRAMFLAFLFYVPFFPFKTWANGFLPGFFGIDPFVIEICTMLLNGILEFCWQKFVIYRKEEDSALAKYNVGEMGEFGEIGVADIEFTGEDIHQMMKAGLDINAMNDKQMKKWLKKN